MSPAVSCQHVAVFRGEVTHGADVAGVKLLIGGAGVNKWGGVINKWGGGFNKWGGRVNKWGGRGGLLLIMMVRYKL